MYIIVEKKDGTEEPFSYDKIVASITKCGVPVQASEEIASALKLWIEDSYKDGRIASGAIRDKIFQTLSKDFPAEADTYKVYKK